MASLIRASNLFLHSFKNPKLVTVILSFLQTLQLLMWSDTSVLHFKYSLTLSTSGLEVNPIAV